MKLLVISARFPYPLNKGDKLRLYHQLIELSKIFDVTLVCISDKKVPDEDLQQVKKICSAVHLFSITRFNIFENIFKGLFKGWPVQVSYFFDQDIKNEIIRLIAYLKPDHIYNQLIRTSEYTKDISVSKTLDYMDCFSMNSLKRSTTSPGLLKKFWKWESLRTKEYEKKIFSFFDQRTIISRADALNMPCPMEALTVVPNGVSGEFLTIDMEKKREIDILFVGNLSYYSNIDAIKYFIRDCYPLLDTANTIVIAGAYPDTSIRRLLKGKSNIQLLANVKEIKEIYSKAKIFIAPITKGTGMQNKVLEAIACGCEVICSKEVLDGVALDLPSISVAKSTVEYIDLIKNKLSHFDQNKEKRTCSKKYISENHTWDKQCKILIDLILLQNK